MKATTIRRPNYAAYRRRAFDKANASNYPNAAGARYYLEKLLDAALAAAITMGVVVILMFVITVLA